MDTFPLSHPQRRIYLSEIESSGRASNNVAAYAPCPVDRKRLEEVLGELLESNPSLRYQLKKQASEDFPEPLTPVTTVITDSGNLTSIPFRLFSRAPRISI